MASGRVRRFFHELGPGLISGAADDDSSGIATYSVTGAALVYGPLWTALFSFPLMAAVQLMCARLGMVTGRGLAAVIRRRYPPPVLWGACVLLSLANTFNIAADLGGMAEATEMVTSVSSLVWAPAYAGLIILLLFRTSYRKVARIFKSLTLVLFAYAITALLAKPDWRAVWNSTFVPDLRLSRAYFSVLLAILGTSISPYLFFWQAAQEVEEERAQGRVFVEQRKGATSEELRGARNDVLVGMFFSNVIMYFIILTTAASLHANGLRTVSTARQAAEALRPLAGSGAYWLFTIGLNSTGMLSVPVLAGSSAFAISEAMAWNASLDQRPRLAPRFYAVIAISLVLGMALDYARVNAVTMLFWAAVANGVLAPPLIALVVLLTTDRDVMENRVNPPILRWIGWFTVVVMALASVGMFVTR